MKKKIKLVGKVLVALLLVLVITFTTTDHAFAQSYDICGRVLDSVILKTTTRSQKVCRAEGKGRFYCFANPVCCTRACLNLPDCTVIRQIEEGIDYISRGDDIACFKRDSAETLYKSWRAGFFEFQFDNITGGFGDVVVDLLEADTERLYAKADDLPQHVKALLAEIIMPVDDGGQTGFGQNQIDRVRIMSEDDARAADWWLRPGQDAITLGNLIIFNQDDYDELIDPLNVFTLNDLKYGLATRAYSNAIAILVHEMVHVKQYDFLGRQTFMESYVLSDIWRNNRGPMEQEAYAFTPNIVQFHGSSWCEQTRENQNFNTIEFDVDTDLIESCSYAETTIVPTLFGLMD